MNQNKIYIPVTEALVNNVVFTIKECGREKELELKELLIAYDKYNHLKFDFEWFKDSVNSIKKSLDKMDFNNENNDKDNIL